MDITDIPLVKRFAYLAVIGNGYSRKVFSSRLSNTMDTSFCLEAMDEVIDGYGVSEVFNIHQGSQLTSEAFTGKLKEYDIGVGMDGKVRGKGRVFVERMWRAFKYEEVDLSGY